MDTKYYTEKTVVVKEYNYNIIKDEINEFLKGYDADIRCYSMSESDWSNTLDVYLEYLWNNDWIGYDEDYYDETIDNYLKELSEKVGCRVSVPLDYYPK